MVGGIKKTPAYSTIVYKIERKKLIDRARDVERADCPIFCDTIKKKRTEKESYIGQDRISFHNYYHRIVAPIFLNLSTTIVYIFSTSSLVNVFSVS